MEYTVIRSERKTVAIQLNQDLTVTVRAPWRASQSEIERILQEKKPWIEKHLAVENRSNTFSGELTLNAYSRGMGGMGLPGDLSSQSRFVRVAFVKMNSLSGDTEEESVSQFFHILGSVDQQRGCYQTS